MWQGGGMTILRATIIGAGGLGGPIAISLGAAGVELVIADHDHVELSNLHRQIQFTAVDLDQPKAARLAGVVVARGGIARSVASRWTMNTADELGADADVVIDATDDPATKFAVADWAVANGRCYVIAAALRYGGNVMVGAPGAACYRCLFEEPVDAPTCADAGVLGPTVGAIGGVAAAAALALARDNRSLAGAILVFEDLRRSTDPRIVRFAPRPGCPACTRAPISPLVTPVSVAEVH
jgi:molybdopterin-synthase adenylyltransferase